MDQSCLNNSKGDRTFSVQDDLAFFDKYKIQIEDLTPSSEDLELSLQKINGYNRELTSQIDNLKAMISKFASSITEPRIQKKNLIQELGVEADKIKQEIARSSEILEEHNTNNKQLKRENDSLREIMQIIKKNKELESDTMSGLDQGIFIAERYN